jgi:hypothetical protein
MDVNQEDIAEFPLLDIHAVQVAQAVHVTPKGIPSVPADEPPSNGGQRNPVSRKEPCVSGMLYLRKVFV